MHLGTKQICKAHVQGTEGDILPFWFAMHIPMLKQKLVIRVATWNLHWLFLKGRHIHWFADWEGQETQFSFVFNPVWSGMARAAQNRVRRQEVVDGLCSTRSDGHK